MRPSSPNSGHSTGESPNLINSSKKTSKVRRLRNEIRVLSNERDALSEQLDSSKDIIFKLESNLKEKHEEINMLKLELDHSGLTELACEGLSNCTDVCNDWKKCDTIAFIGETVSEEDSESNMNAIDQLKMEKTLIENLNSELLQKVQNLENHIIYVENELSQMTNSKTEFEREALEVKDELLKITEINHLKVSQLEELKKELNECISYKEKDNVELKEKLNLSRSECEGMKFKLNELQLSLEELSNSKNKLKQSKDEVISSLKESIFTLNENISKSQKDQASICQQAETKINNLKDQLKIAEDQEITLRDALKEAIPNALQEKGNFLNNLKTTIESYKKNIDECDSEIMSLKEILEIKETVINELKLKQDSLQWEFDINLKQKEEELKKKIEQARSLEAALNESEKQNVSINNHLQFLNSELEEKSILIKNNENDLRNLECQNLFLTNTLQEKDLIVVSMQSSIDLSNEELLSLRAKQNYLSTEIQSKDSYIYQLQSEIQALKSSIESNCFEKESLIKTIKEKEYCLQDCFMKLDDVRVNLGRKLNDLETELQDKVKKYNDIDEERLLKDEQLKFSQQQLHCLEVKVKEKDNEIMKNISLIGKLDSEIEEFKTTTSELTEKLTLAEGKVQAVENELHSKKSLITSLVSEVAMLKAQECLAQTDKQILENQLVEKEECIRILEQQIQKNEFEAKVQEEQFHRELNEQKAIVNEMKCSINKFDSQLIQFKQNIENLNLDLDNKSMIISNYESKIKTYESENKLIWEENQCLVKELSSKGDIVTELKYKINICEEDISRLNNEKINQSHELEKYVDKFESQIKRIENLQQEISECKEKEALQSCIIDKKTHSIAALEEFTKHLKESRDTNSKHCCQLEMEISALKEITRNHECKIFTLEFQLKEKNTSINSLMSTKNVLDVKTKLFETTELLLKKALNAKEEEVSNLHHKLEEANSKISELEVECSEHNQSLKAMFKTLRSQNSELNEKCCEIATLQEETKRLNQKLTEEKTLPAQRKKSKFKRA